MVVLGLGDGQGGAGGVFGVVCLSKYAQLVFDYRYYYVDGLSDEKRYLVD